MSELDHVTLCDLIRVEYNKNILEKYVEQAMIEKTRALKKKEIDCYNDLIAGIEQYKFTVQQITDVLKSYVRERELVLKKMAK